MLTDLLVGFVVSVSTSWSAAMDTDKFLERLEPGK
jgi:hypothetical protein